MVTLNTHPGSHGSSHEHVGVDFGLDVASASRDAAVTAPASPWCVHILNSRPPSRRSIMSLSHFLKFRERRLCTPICSFMKYASPASYYGARFFSLHHFWFTIYRLAPTTRKSDMENPATSRRTSWTEAVNRMQKLWTLIMTVPVVIIPWVTQIRQ